MLLGPVRLLYNLVFPIGFLCFLPGLIWKYRHRGGWKSTFGERFGRFSPERVRELGEYSGAVWIHAVSVGETVIALALLKRWRLRCPERRFVLSTGTTTAQELARKAALPGVAVIFSPIDAWWIVRKFLKLLRPGMLVIFETEIWPNLIVMARAAGVPTALVNARMSDHSARGYRRARGFFGPLLGCFRLIAAQSPGDAERFRTVSPAARIEVTGNLKFDQEVPADLTGIDYAAEFGGPVQVLLGASTHPGEEALLIETFGTLRAEFPDLRLVLVPRHAERGDEIVKLLRGAKIPFIRRGTGERDNAPLALLADTTGEMLKLMKTADVVVMGKSLAGQDEGHNLIEPALLNRAIVTGAVLRNFRLILQVLSEAGALCLIHQDTELTGRLRKLLADPAERRRIGDLAGATIRSNSGALEHTINLLEEMK